MLANLVAVPHDMNYIVNLNGKIIRVINDSILFEISSGNVWIYEKQYFIHELTRRLISESKDHGTEDETNPILFNL